MNQSIHQTQMSRIVSIFKARTDVQLKRAFAKIDQDNDGMISQTEFQEGLKKMGGKAIEALKTVEANPAGKISMDQFLEALRKVNVKNLTPQEATRQVPEEKAPKITGGSGDSLDIYA